VEAKGAYAFGRGGKRKARESVGLPGPRTGVSDFEKVSTIWVVVEARPTVQERERLGQKTVKCRKPAHNSSPEGGCELRGGCEQGGRGNLCLDSKGKVSKQQPRNREGNKKRKRNTRNAAPYLRHPTEGQDWMTAELGRRQERQIKSQESGGEKGSGERGGGQDIYKTQYRNK